MSLLDLKVNNVRNLKKVEINPAPHINLIYGPNASGKTSLLESIYVLSRGKSFRTHHLAHVINRESNMFTITSCVATHEGHRTRLGIEHTEGRSRMKAEGAPLKRASELAGYLPVIIINQEYSQFFNLGPKSRRRFLDWGVFHVEPSFLTLWRRYNRALRQRNVLLQDSRRAASTGSWDDELDYAAERLDTLRSNYVQRLTDLCQAYFSRLFNDETVFSIHYRRGWQDGARLSTILKQSFARDRALGYTHSGPHRADLRIMLRARPAQELVSRGQLKLLVYTLYLAQASLFQEITGRPCIILADDIGAELDATRMSSLMNLIQEMGVQVFVTMTERDREIYREGPVQKMFHVEHGWIKEVI